MNQAIKKLGLCALVCLLVAGCHSSNPTTPAPAAQSAAVAPQPAPAPVVVPQPAPKELVCTGHTNGDDAAFVETSTLYPLMNGKLGGWSSCVEKKLSKTDDETTVTFVGGATLTVSLFPSSDAGAQEAVLPAGTSITREDAIKALKGELPDDGCGVKWSKLSAGGPNATGDYKASGTSCTVDLHVKMMKGSVVGFGFGMAA